jgi:hypothetical protein
MVDEMIPSIVEPIELATHGCVSPLCQGCSCRAMITVASAGEPNVLSIVGICEPFGRCEGEVSCRGPVAMPRHSCARLLDPKKLPGALVPGLRSEFAQVVREPVPNYLAELIRRLDEEPNGFGRG